MRHNAEQEAPWRLPVSVLMAGEGRGGGENGGGEVGRGEGGRRIFNPTLKLDRP